MSDTLFTDGLTVIPAAWANDVNDVTYKCSSIAELKTLSKSRNRRVIVLGYSTPGDGGGGIYYYDFTDSISADNGGTIIVANDGGRWKYLNLTQGVLVDVFGADPTGATDSTTAINKAITALGGQLKFRSGAIYSCSGELTLENLFSVTLLGGGRGSPTIHNNTTVLKFTGTTGTFINIKSTISCAIDGLRITYSNGSFTGYLIDASHGSSGRDTSLLEVRNVHLGAYNGALYTAVGINLDKAIGSSFRCVSADTLNYAVQGQNAAGGSYSNAHEFVSCHFADTIKNPIQDMGDGWSFIGSNVFEPRNDGHAGALQNSSSTPFDGLTLHGNWFGDVTVGGGTWVVLHDCTGISVRGNRMGGDGTSQAFSLNNVTGFDTGGNTFKVFNTVYSFGSGTTTKFTDDGSNNYYTCTTIYGTPSNCTSFKQANPGYVYLANGFIKQFGSSSVTIGTPLKVTLPVSFGNTNWTFTHSLYTPPGTNNGFSTTLKNNGDITLNCTGTAGTATVDWEATGYVS